MKTRNLKVEITKKFGTKERNCQNLAFFMLRSTLASRGVMPCARTSLGIWSAMVAIVFPCFAGEAIFSSAEAAENRDWGLGTRDWGLGIKKDILNSITNRQ
ncbi:hypothetical protein, partial [Scytonema sp. NUACC26]|uniref:hypothetical protein n=1 Tax=Scytonema sp. NUACC26 TaxID=3140176 RepID=UPI0038B353F1